jgi:tryptophan synthase alpha chain
MNRITDLFTRKKSNICSVFLTAGYPNLNATVTNVLQLEKAGVDMIELGMPFSDPLADGETIQGASLVALKNGMNIQLLFDQIEEIRKKSEIPLVLMGYLNPVLSFGLEEFLQRCDERGVDSLIIPDLSLDEYELGYIEMFEKYQIGLTFLVTPKTSLDRIKKIQNHTTTFIYFVSSSGTTGKSKQFSVEQIEEFEKYRKLKLAVPTLMGFGVYSKETFNVACEYFNGGIIGSAFIRSLQSGKEIQSFVEELREGSEVSQKL